MRVILLTGCLASLLFTYVSIIELDYMKKILFVICLLAGASCIFSWRNKLPKKKYKAKFKVTGSIMQTVSYCGGAVPTKEMLIKARTPAGIPFGKLFIRNATANTNSVTITDSIQADATGNFSMDLPAGNYCLVEEWKTKPFTLPLNTKVQTVDSACYRKLYDACDYELHISDKDITDIKIVFHRPCFYNQPCISYKGRMPH